MARVTGKRLEVDAVTMSYFQGPPDFERDRGLTDRRPAYPQRLREIALGREAVTHLQPCDLDIVEQLGGELLVEPAPVRGTKGLGTRSRGPLAPRHRVASPLL